MKEILLDLEANGYLRNATKVHCIVCKDFNTKEVFIFKSLEDFLKWAPKDALWIIHNGIGYDAPLINKLSGKTILPHHQVIDTMICSKLFNYKGYLTHSLKELGESLKVYKGDYTGGFEVFTQEMLDYCVQDVEVLEAIYSKYRPQILDPVWKSSLRAEHDMSAICTDMEINGFSFDKTKAEVYLKEITEEMSILEDSFSKEFNKELVEVKRLKMRYLKEGGPVKVCEVAMTSYPKTEVVGSELICYDYREFNPGSTVDRINVLTEAGWSPHEMTKGHMKYLRDIRFGGLKPDPKKAKRYRKYGWKVNEDNLKTLPATAPQAARDLATWLTLEGRRSSLQEWIDQVEPDGKIHGTFWNIGAWTQRMSHSNPNQGNIFACWDPKIKPASPIEEVKAKYDTKLRGLWRASPGCYLVGTDAEAIQLRVLAHYMVSKRYVTAILEGNKDDETDIHNVNKSALGPICRSRDDAKTFIYAWLLGAGIGKVASILNCSQAQAKNAVSNFLDSLPELKRIKQIKIPHDARLGYFTGLDGRKVKCSSEHLMLSGYLQEGESTIMKHANILWRKLVEQEGIPYQQLDFVHDEWVVECNTKEDAERVGLLQRQALEQTGVNLGLFCPLSGETKIGTTWAEVH